MGLKSVSHKYCIAAICFQCVILTEVPLPVQLKVNAYCRAHGIKVTAVTLYKTTLYNAILDVTVSYDPHLD